MRRTAVLGVLAIIASMGGGGPAMAQAVRLGVIMDMPRSQLSESWDDLNPRQVERAYCVVDWSYGVYHVSRSAPVQDDTIFRVFAIKDAAAENESPVSADFQCPDGIPELHVHTPTTCMSDDVETCKMGGLNAYSCQPSRGDYEKLIQRGDEFGVIQCDKRSFRFYYPGDYMSPGIAALAAAKRKAGNLTAAMKAAQGGP